MVHLSATRAMISRTSFSTWPSIADEEMEIMKLTGNTILITGVAPALAAGWLTRFTGWATR